MLQHGVDDVVNRVEGGIVLLGGVVLPPDVLDVLEDKCLLFLHVLVRCLLKWSRILLVEIKVGRTNADLYLSVNQSVIDVLELNQFQLELTFDIFDLTHLLEALPIV